MKLEIEEMGIVVNDNALRNIIKNDKLFTRDDKFSRTEYEKFLLKSGLTAPSFEKNISEQESRRQLLSSLSGGLVIPSILVEKAFNKENQIKTIRFIDLEKYYLSKSPSQTEIKEIYENNKDMFTEEFKSFVYAEVNPQNLTGKSVYDENFYRNLDILENKLLDGQSFEEAAKDNNLKILNYKKINSNMQNKEKQLKIYLISYLKKFTISNQ